MIKGKFAAAERKRKIAELSWNLTFRLTDLTLLTLFLGLSLSMPSKHTGKFLGKAFNKIKQNIDEEQIKRAVYQLKKSGLVDYGRNLWLDPKITLAGKKRLRAIFPEYDSERIWNGRLYLITYDIPEKKKWQRDRLRRFLKKIGCGLLQESTWITPYNPKVVLEEFVAEAGLSGLILISDLGKDGQVGQEDLRSLIDRVFGLTAINQRYRQFLEKVQNKKFTTEEKSMYFYSILRDDPQLPFELLPDNWLGEHAWETTTNTSGRGD